MECFCSFPATCSAFRESAKYVGNTNLDIRHVVPALLRVSTTLSVTAGGNVNLEYHPGRCRLPRFRGSRLMARKRLGLFRIFGFRNGVTKAFRLFNGIRSYFDLAYAVSRTFTLSPTFNSRILAQRDSELLAFVGCVALQSDFFTFIFAIRASSPNPICAFFTGSVKLSAHAHRLIEYTQEKHNCFDNTYTGNSHLYLQKCFLPSVCSYFTPFQKTGIGEWCRYARPKER